MDEVATPAAPTVRQIYPALVAVASDLAKVGIAKDRKNEQQGFRFRGIDDVMNVVSPILAKHHVVFLVAYEPDGPDVERITKKETTLIYAKVRGTFSFISAVDGSYVTVTAPGTAMDSGDKASNKAMSASLKYALLHTFLIPTESNEDADATTPDPSVPIPPAGFDDWFLDLSAAADTGYGPVIAAFKKSREPLRTYALKYRKPEWEAMKERGKRVKAAAAASAAEPAVP